MKALSSGSSGVEHILSLLKVSEFSYRRALGLIVKRERWKPHAHAKVARARSMIDPSVKDASVKDASMEIIAWSVVQLPAISRITLGLTTSTSVHLVVSFAGSCEV